MRAEDVLLLGLDTELATALEELDDATDGTLEAPLVVVLEEDTPTEGAALVPLVGIDAELLTVRVVLDDVDDC
jgi:hypothetical protein